MKTEGDSERLWTVAEGIRRTIGYAPGKGIRAKSFANPLTGTSFLARGVPSEEFLVDVDGTHISGTDGRLILRDSSTVTAGNAAVTTVTLEREGLEVDLRYADYRTLPVMGKSILLRNASRERQFEIGGMFASERLVFEMRAGLRVQWLNGIMSPLNSTTAFAHLEYGLNDQALVAGEGKVFTTQVPLDMTGQQQWGQVKRPAPNHSNYSYFPWIVLWDQESREGVFLGLEWSGPWRIEIEPSAKVCVLTVSYGTDFHHTLCPGESIEGVGLFEGVFRGTLEEAGIATQVFMERFISPRATGNRVAASGRRSTDTEACACGIASAFVPFAVPPACWNTWYKFTTTFDERLLRDQAREAASLGFEAFVVDYGWSRSAMDRREDRVKFPSGIRAMSKEVRKLGMKFGVWVCIAGLDPRTAPEAGYDRWLVRNADGSVHDESDLIAGTCACLASGFERHLLDDLDRVIGEYGIDWLKFDQNMFFNCHSRGHDHQNEHDAPYLQVRAFYRILDAILDRHPGLFIECALNGAMILDYGVLARSGGACLTDNTKSYYIRRILHGISYPLPPRFCTAYVAPPALNNDPTAADLGQRAEPARRRRYCDYFYRAGLIGGLNTSEDLQLMPPEAKESLRRVLDIYRTTRRRIAAPIRHLSPQPFDPREWDAYEIYDGRIGEGMIIAFRPSSPQSTKRFRLAGVEADARYDIRSENCGVAIATASGEELMSKGIDITIEESTGSEILFLERK